MEKLALSAAELAQARKEVNTSPTEAQREAGNYAKGEVRFKGLTLTIENPVGSVRSGTNKAGKRWSVTMKNDYGYINGYQGADKDQVDVFIGPDLDSELVYVIDQNDPATGKFDECKCVVGVVSEAQARKLYEDNFSKGWKGFRQATAMTMPQFRWWLEHGDKSKPIDKGAFAKRAADSVQAYKLFRTLPSRPGSLFPLFIDKSSPVPQDEWVPAENIPTEGFAPRPGWHAGSLPSAPHLRSKEDRIQPGRVWAEVELPADVDWQSVADASPTGDVRDQVPEGGHYRKKMPRMQGGEWLIGGGMKIRQVLSDDQVSELLRQAGELEAAEKERRVPSGKEAADEIKIPMDSVRQETEYTCGPAALKAVEDYYEGEDIPEEEIAEEAGTTERAGTDPDSMVEAAEEMGYTVEMVEDMTTDQLKNLLDEGIPVICGIQAWGDPEDYDDEELPSGHYVVAIGYDDDNIYFEDPGMDGRGYIPTAEFVRRWHDKAYKGRRYDHLGIVLYKPELPEPDPEDDDEDTSKIGGDAAGRGIPDRREYGDLSKLSPGQLADFIVQLHDAQRAGRHFDYRIGSPELGLYSWASRHELPEPGKRRVFFQQPLHQHSYGNFQGTLKGYGAGTVRTHRKGQVLITKVTPTKIEFTTADERYPQRYAMVKPQTFKEKDWLLINTTPDQEVPYAKEHMVKIPAEKVEDTLKQLKQGDSVQAKIDGASSLVRLLKDGVEVLSYRTSKVTGRPIVHTERVFGGRPTMEIPPELVGSVLKGELYGIRDESQGDSTVDRDGQGQDGEGRGQGQSAASGSLSPGDRVAQSAVAQEEVSGTGSSQEGEAAAQAAASASEALPGAPGGVDQAPGPLRGSGDRGLGARRHGTGTQGGAGVIGPQELGGLLNSTLGESLRQQQEQKVKLRLMLHGIQKLGKRQIDPNVVPYNERMALIREAVMPHLPADTFHPAESAEDPVQLWNQVRSGQHPLTREGIVIHPSLGRPSKGKLLEEQDVYVTGTFPGEGKYRGRGVGGFTYALAPGGPEAGKVGTGLTDALRSDMHLHPESYVGRVARVRSQGPFDSGALRAPALIALHEDYPTFEEKTSADLFDLIELGIVKDADEAHVPTVAVDLDGTLAQEMEPFDPEQIGEPRKGARKWMKKFKDAGARIIIFTVRGDEEMVADWLQDHDIPYDFINYNPDQPEGSSDKVIADVYWDDRAVSAKGPVAESAPLVMRKLKAAEDSFLLVYPSPEDVLEVIKLLRAA